MTHQFATTKTGSGVQYDLGTTDDLTILPGIAVGSTDTRTIAVSGGDQTIDILGTIAGLAGIQVNTPSDIKTPNKIYIGAGGSITTASHAIRSDSADLKIINYGQISSYDSDAIYIDDTNHSAIQLNILNNGSIHADTYCVRLLGVNFFNVNLTNNGTMSALAGYVYSAEAASSNDTIVNRGRMDGSLNLTSGSDKLINRGAISGDVIRLDGTFLLDNRLGTIDGSIYMGFGNDTLIPGAGVENADGSDGTDLLDFTRSSGVALSLDDSIDATGWAKDDTFVNFENITGSSTGADTLIGSDADNVLSGLGGNDTLTGQAGDDTLLGGRGGDTLSGGDGVDMLDGGIGIDILLGGAGDDTILGGAGNDTITGGTGIDKLTGGTGGDKFVFSLPDLTGGVSVNVQYDRILDFSRAERDKIDLSAIDANTALAKDQAFTFIGTAEFSKVAGELKIQASASGFFVQGDTNGNGTADFTISVASAAALLATDFVL